MRKHALAILILAAVVNAGVLSAEEVKKKRYAIEENEVAGMLTERFSRDFIRDAMLSRKSWRPFPKASDRKAWGSFLLHELNKARRDYIVAEAESLLGKPWPQLPATLYMEYARNGNRSRYQDPYFQRRENLSALVLAECMEHKGRFLDEIANGIWAITEEATWCVPAHAGRLSGDVLQRQDVESVDLFACETAMTLATAHYLLEDELEALSPALCDRVRREVMRRVVEPVETGHDFGRAGWLDGHNNWSPWCASNVLGSAMLLMEDQDRVARITQRLMVVVDRFINGYGDDGGCDEGPGYWGEAGGAMIVFLELVNSRTDRAIEEIYKDPKIAAMGEFITRAHIDGSWFANFADASPRSHPHPGKVYRFGQRTGSESMKNMALLVMRDWDPQGSVNPPIRMSGVSRPLWGPLMEMFWVPADAGPVEWRHEPESWLPDLQVLFAHESSKGNKGLALATKGGHNAESHNHNDIGHFIIFLDGQPGIIDIGAETYTQKTFSKDRYDIWAIRASGHNAPLVNGVEQAAGRQYRAKDVEFAKNGDNLHLSMDLADAYPEKARIGSLIREIDFTRGSNAEIKIRDSLDLERGPSVLQTDLYAAAPVKKIRDGLLAIQCKPRKLMLRYTPESADVSIEAVSIPDSKIRSNWGDKLYRIRFEQKLEKGKGTQEFRFFAAE